MLPRTLPFPGTNHMVSIFRHAMSLDEHRAAFQVQPWQRSIMNKDKVDELREKGRKRIGLMRTAFGLVGDTAKTGTSLIPPASNGDADAVIPLGKGKGTDCKEVYFPGCHTGECPDGSLMMRCLTRRFPVSFPQMSEGGPCQLTRNGHFIIFHSAG